MVEFVEFPKIGRLKRACVISEKIDGTNAGIQIVDVAERHDPRCLAVVGDFAIFAQSRNRIITIGDDNFGFAAWVTGNAVELANLGTGTHFGEWWGAGIGRKYGSPPRRFSLFNTFRWSDARGERPSCCDVVPVLCEGDFTTQAVDDTITKLAIDGSRAAPGFMNPEGVIVYHVATKTYFKRTIHGDDKGKEWGA
jgi:hypothetical protein